MYSTGRKGHLTECCDVQKLDLGFRDLSRIESLWEFTNVTILHLNNNWIQKIEGLNRLTNLITLDLAFNNITQIEGLETLKKLEELNLYNNKISVLENMDSLEMLVYFNIANNNLKDRNQAMCLRKLKNISTLNFFGNPFSEEADYELFVLAFFPNLKVLDNKYVPPEAKKEAAEKFHFDIQIVLREDTERGNKAEELKRQQDELRLHEDAFVEFLNGSFLFELMLKDDPLANKLQSVPEIADEQKSFRQELTALCVQLFETGLVELQRRQAEVSSFFKSHSTTKAETVQKETRLLEDFGKYFTELKSESSSEILKASPGDELRKLHKSLLTLEFKLIGQIEMMIKLLDVEITEMTNSFIKTAQDVFAQCQDLEDKYHEKIQGIVAAIIENVANHGVEGMSEDVKMMFLDKETVTGALTTAHENHLITIRDRETQLINRTSAWKSNLIKKLEKEELYRNRTSLSDFTIYVEHTEEEIRRLFN